MQDAKKVSTIFDRVHLQIFLSVVALLLTCLRATAFSRPDDSNAYSIESLVDRELKSCPVPYLLAYCSQGASRLNLCGKPHWSPLDDLNLLSAGTKPICPFPTIMLFDKSHT